MKLALFIHKSYISTFAAVLVVLAFGVGLFGASALAQDTGSAPTYSRYNESVLIPYSREADFHELKKLLFVRAQINGGPVSEFNVDTGSVGIVVGADEVPNINPDAKPDSILYTSSGIKLSGVRTTAVVTFPDAQGGTAIAVVPVLAVKSVVCTGQGVNTAHCQPHDHPHPHMLGIGFGRGQGLGHPEFDPFVNLQQMKAGTMSRGYIIAPNGITLGLTAKAVGSGFVWQKLTERKVSPETTAGYGSLKDWETTPGAFKVGELPNFQGTVLMDTGLTNMMFASPGGPSSGDVQEGTPVTIDLLNGQLHYTFHVGDMNNPQTPRRVSWVSPSLHGVYVNTGLRALAAYDYLFDNDDGWLALRPRKE